MQYDIVHQLRSTAHVKGKEQTTSVGLLSALKNPSALIHVGKRTLFYSLRFE